MSMSGPAQKQFNRLKDVFLGSLKTMSDAEVVKELVQAQPLVDSGELSLDTPIKGSGMTMLHSASFYGKVAAIRWLLEHGATANCKNKKGLTPLHFLCSQPNAPGRQDGIELVMRAGGDVDAKNYVGKSPYDYGKAEGFDAKEFFRQKGGSLAGPAEGASQGGSVARQNTAAQMKRIGQQINRAEKKLQILFADLANPDNQEAALKALEDNKSLQIDLDAEIEGHKAKWHFLHAAVMQSAVDIVQSLLDGKANPNIQTAKGNTPMHLVITHIDDPDAKRTVELLMEAGADLSIKSYLRGQSAEDLLTSDSDRSWLANLKRETANARTALERKSKESGLFEANIKAADGKSASMPAAQTMANTSPGPAVGPSSGGLDVKQPPADPNSGGGILERMLRANADYTTAVSKSRTSADDALRAKLRRGRKKKKSTNLLDSLLGDMLGGMRKSVETSKASAQNSFLAKLKRGKMRKRLLRGEGDGKGPGGAKAGKKDNAPLDALAMLTAKKKKAKQMLSGEEIHRKLIKEIFELLDTDGSRHLEFNEIEQLMMVIGDRLGIGAEEFFEQADQDHNGKVEPEELAGFMRKQHVDNDKLEELVRLIRAGIGGAVERYDAAKRLLSSIIEGDIDALQGALSKAQHDAADLLRHKLLKGKKKASKNLLDALMNEAGGDSLSNIMSASRDAANEKILMKLAQSKRKKLIKMLVHDVLDTDDILLNPQQVIKSIVVNIFKMFDAVKRGAINTKDLAQLSLIIGDRVWMTQGEMGQQLDAKSTGSVGGQELLSFLKGKEYSLDDLKTLNSLTGAGLRGAIKRYEEAIQIVNHMVDGTEEDISDGVVAQGRSAASELFRFKLAKEDSKEAKLLMHDLGMGDVDVEELRTEGNRTDAYDRIRLTLGAAINKPLVKERVRDLLDPAQLIKNPGQLCKMILEDMLEMIGADESTAELENRDVKAIMVVIGDRMPASAAEVMGALDSNGSGRINTQKFAEWFKARSLPLATLLQLQGAIKLGVQGTIERYERAATLLKKVADLELQVNPGKLPPDQEDAADLLRFRLVKGKQTASKALVNALSVLQNDVKGMLDPSKRDHQNQRLLAKLASSRKKKVVRDLIDEVLGIQELQKLVSAGDADSLANLLANLRKGRSKDSIDLLKQLLAGGDFNGQDDEYKLLMALLVVDIWKELGRRSDEDLILQDVEELVAITGNRLQVTPKQLLAQATAGRGSLSAQELKAWFEKRGTSLEELRDLHAVILEGSDVKTKLMDQKRARNTANGIHRIVGNDAFVLDLLGSLGVDPETLRVLQAQLESSMGRREELKTLLGRLKTEYDKVIGKPAELEKLDQMLAEAEARASQLLALTVDAGYVVLNTIMNHPNLDDAARAVLKTKILIADKLKATSIELLRYIINDRVTVAAALGFPDVTEKVSKILMALRMQCQEKQRLSADLLANLVVDQRIIAKLLDRPQARGEYTVKLAGRLIKHKGRTGDLTETIDGNIGKLVSCVDQSTVGFHSTILKIKSEEDEARLHAVQEVCKYLLEDNDRLRNAPAGQAKALAVDMQKKMFVGSQLLVNLIQDDLVIEQTHQELKKAKFDSEDTRKVLKLLSYSRVKSFAIERYLNDTSSESLALSSLGTPAEMLAIVAAKSSKDKDDVSASNLLRALRQNEELVASVHAVAKANADAWLASRLKKGKKKRSADLLKILFESGDAIGDVHNKAQYDAADALRRKMARRKKRNADSTADAPRVARQLALKDFEMYRQKLGSEVNSRKGRLWGELTAEALPLPEINSAADLDLWMEPDVEEINRQFESDLAMLWDTLDEHRNGRVGAREIQIFLEEICDKHLPIKLVSDVMAEITPAPGKIVTQPFFLPVVQALCLTEYRKESINWDMMLLDASACGRLGQRSSESLWATNRIDRGQPGLRSVTKKMKGDAALGMSWPELYSSLVTTKPSVKRFYYEGEYEPNFR